MEIKFSDWKSKDVDSIIFVLGDGSNICECVKSHYERLLQKKVFKNKSGETVTTTVEIDGKIVDVALVGGGQKISKKFINGLASAFRSLKALKAEKIGVNLEAIKSGEKKLSRALGELFIMADYEFNEFKSDAKPSSVNQILIKGLEKDAAAFEEGRILGESNLYARMLTNTPANIMTPEVLAKYAKVEGEKLGIEVEVIGKTEIEKLGMKAYLSVAQGSDNEPKLIVMRWKGNKSSKEILGYVGKGVTYDSGGLSLKPTSSMVTMKDDMSGASAVIGAILGIARLKLNINVTVVVAACENMPSGRSYKPGDIISSMGGKTIFVGNTDAEGRLTLVDAVTYIIDKEKVTKLVDVATLTGAAVRALGMTVSAVCSNNDDFYKDVEKSFEKVDENMWRMPLFEDYRPALKHEEADLNNSAGTPGMMTAALFIEAFVNDMPWVHIDIAGPAYAEKATPLNCKGGTGSAVRPLIKLAKRLQK